MINKSNMPKRSTSKGQAQQQRARTAGGQKANGKRMNSSKSEADQSGKELLQQTDIDDLMFWKNKESLQRAEKDNRQKSARPNKQTLSDSIHHAARSAQNQNTASFDEPGESKYGAATVMHSTDLIDSTNSGDLNSSGDSNNSGDSTSSGDSTDSADYRVPNGDTGDSQEDDTPMKSAAPKRKHNKNMAPGNLRPAARGPATPANAICSLCLSRMITDQGIGHRPYRPQSRSRGPYM